MESKNIEIWVKLNNKNKILYTQSTKLGHNEY